MSTQPGVGRIVHYVAYGSADGTYPTACLAAVVTGRAHDDGTVALAVLNPTGMFFNDAIEYDAGRAGEGIPTQPLCDDLGHRGGTWHWPVRT